MTAVSTTPQDKPSVRIVGKEADRIGSIDFAKGVLVVLMVVYHTLNYSAWPRLPGQYMAFLPPSFILISGFLLTNIYAAKYQAGAWLLNRRLLVRGFKLVLIFVALNVLSNVVVTQSYHGQKMSLDGFFDELRAFFVWGNTPRAAFGILLPIGYLLFAAPVLLWAYAANRYFPFCLAVLSVGGCLVLEQTGLESSNANMLSVGVIGTAAGVIPLARVNEWLTRRWPVVIASCAAYWACRAVWGQTYLVQVFAACVAVPLVQTAAVWIESSSWWFQEVCRLGRYSLFAYIAHIAILQVIHRAHIIDASAAGAVIGMGAGTLAATWGTVRLLDFIRPRSTMVDRGYRSIFG